MKHMKIIIAVLLVLAMSVGVSYGETGRLGAVTYNSYNPSGRLVKTADYTLTTANSDYQIDFDATSAAITGTLPTVSSCLAGKACSYKVKKTDSSVNTVTLSPASGDTIGGESARVIVNQNGYIIVSAGPGRNWTVQYESPYVVEDHEAGSSDLGTQAYDLSIIFEGATVDAYETTFGVVDPTADGSLLIPALTTGTTQYTMMTSLATNKADAANAVTGVSNGLLLEGATANGYELTVTTADPTADVTATFPNGTGTVMLTSLATNTVGAANSVTGVSNGMQFEGATADDYETTVTVADATADSTFTIPNITATAAGVDGLASRVTTTTITGSVVLTTSDCGKTIFIGTDGLTLTLPATSAGCIIRVVNSGAAGNNIMTIDPNASDNIWGTFTLAASVVVSEGAAGVTIVNTKATSIKGDSVTLVGDGADGYYVLNSTGIWAEGA